MFIIFVETSNLKNLIKNYSNILINNTKLVNKKVIRVKFKKISKN